MAVSWQKRLSNMDVNQESAEAMITLNISVQTISFPALKLHLASSKQDIFLKTNFSFYNLVIRDFNCVLTQLREHMWYTYNGTCTNVSVDTDLKMDLRLPRSRLMTLQYHHGDGQLLQDIQDHLVTRTILAKLGVSDLELSLKVSNL